MKSLLLKKNDVIGIVAPSSPVIGTNLEKSYKKGLEEIVKMGFKYKEGKTVYLKNGKHLEVCVGIHSGPVISGVVGETKP